MEIQKLLIPAALTPQNLQKLLDIYWCDTIFVEPEDIEFTLTLMPHMLFTILLRSDSGRTGRRYNADDIFNETQSRRLMPFYRFIPSIFTDDFHCGGCDIFYTGCHRLAKHMKEFHPEGESAERYPHYKFDYDKCFEILNTCFPDST